MLLVIQRIQVIVVTPMVQAGEILAMEGILILRIITIHIDPLAIGIVKTIMIHTDLKMSQILEILLTDIATIINSTDTAETHPVINTPNRTIQETPEAIHHHRSSINLNLIIAITTRTEMEIKNLK
jgi:hypothetical protein